MSMAAYIQHVEQLLEDELHSRATQLAGITRKHTAELIAHISVIADKKAFRPEYTSLFTYCMNALGLSEGETHVRTQVANVCRRFPELLDSLGASRMSLTVAGKLAPHLNMENASALIAACEGMTRRQVEEYLVQFKHGKEVTPGIRAVASTNTLPAPTNTLPAPTTEEASHEPMAEASHPPSLPVPSFHRPTRRIEPVKPDVFNCRFAASGAFKNKLERLAEVVGVVDVVGNLAKLIEMAIEHALEARDPARKLERRRKRQARKAAAEQISGAAPTSASPRPDEDASASDTKITPPAAPAKASAGPSARECSFSTRIQRTSRAGVRACELPLRVRHARWRAVRRTHGVTDRSHRTARDAWSNGTRQPALFLRSSQSLGGGAGVWEGVHTRQDRGGSLETNWGSSSSSSGAGHGDWGMTMK